MTDFSIKQNDTAPSIKAQLLNSENKPKLLNSVSDVKFSMYSVTNDENVISKKSAQIFDEDESIVIYDWDNGDTEISGHHKAEFELTYNDGTIETFPNNDYIDIYIEEEIE